MEFPIYAEDRRIWSFMTAGRIENFFQIRSRDKEKVSAPKKRSGIRDLFAPRPWKADFNQCTGAQLIRALVRAEKRHKHYKGDLPFVLIGHSKLFTERNRRSLAPFLRFIEMHPTRFQFGTFSDFDLPTLRNRLPNCKIDDPPRRSAGIK